jgi:outer membrane protein assembly factor BamB
MNSWTASAGAFKAMSLLAVLAMVDPLLASPVWTTFRGEPYPLSVGPSKTWYYTPEYYIDFKTQRKLPGTSSTYVVNGRIRNEDMNPSLIHQLAVNCSTLQIKWLISGMDSPWTKVKRTSAEARIAHAVCNS